MVITLSGRFDVAAIIADALENADLTGLGPNETSEYEVTDSDVDVDEDGRVTVRVTVERVEGANASKASVLEALTEALLEVDHLEIDQ